MVEHSRFGHRLNNDLSGAKTTLRKLLQMLITGCIVFSSGPAFSQVPTSTLYGIDFSPYLDGQDPNLGSQITTAQITARLQVIAPYTRWIRTFSSTHGLENIPAIARRFGLKVAANAWLSKDLAQNASEIASLISNANAGLVDIAVVGSEAILRNDITEAQLLAYMNQVRQAIPANVPVTTADVWGTFIAHPNLMAASDIVFANFYPYWEGTSVENAVCSLTQEYQRLVAASGSRPVAVSETGWPSSGNAIGAAILSAENANLYALQYLSWAAVNKIPSFYFEAFDESWKVASEGPQGAHWGIWDTNGVLKPGMDALFNGQSTSLSCDGTIPGPVAIEFTYVPPYGSGDFLEVQVNGVRPSAYVLATYIKVGSGWWSKPTFLDPTVPINPDGTATINIATGGSDEVATDIVVFMIPNGMTPPAASGGTLPAVPAAVASVQATRTQSSISGIVVDDQNNPIKGVMISDPVLGSTQTGPDGRYSFYRITNTGTATLAVSREGYTFPESPKNVSILPGNLVVNFTGTLLLPDVPHNVFPLNGSTEVSSIVTLGWTGGSGATSYDVYFGASSSPPFVTKTTQTSYNPGTLDPGTTYYWKIIAENRAGSAVWETWSFTTTHGSVKLGAVRGDLDGDGIPDLFWQNDYTRQVGVWYLTGPQALTVARLGYPAAGTYPGWTLVTIADMDRNGVPDLVWQNDETRQVGVWYMGGTDGLTVLAIAYPAPGSYPGWRLAAVADMDGNGVPDLIWQNDSTRAVGTWYMGGPQGTTLLNVAYQAPDNYPGWSLVAVADMNDDGTPDLIWQNDSTRAVGTWYMSDARALTRAKIAYQAPGTYPGWKVIGVVDMDGNGVPDLIWQNDTTRTVGTWYMAGPDGTILVGTGYQAPGNYSGWRAVGPK